MSCCLFSGASITTCARSRASIKMQAVAITDPRFTRIQKNVLALTADGDPDASFCTTNANAPGVNRCQRVVFLEHEFCGCVFELHG